MIEKISYSSDIARQMVDSFKMLPKVVSGVSSDVIMQAVCGAVSRGFAIAPDCICPEVITMIGRFPYDYNATFYKSWKDVTSKNRLELLFDQLCHYMTTYGTDFTGHTYVPNAEHDIVPFNELEVIESVDIKVIADKCYDMLCSGIAMGKNTIDMCCYAISEAVKNGASYDYSLIKNKEAMCIISCITKTLPELSPVELFRLLIFCAVDQTLIIKSKELISAIKKLKTFNISEFCSYFNVGVEETLVKLSSVFYRFKPLFLAFRNNTENKQLVNKIRRYAVSHHTPLQVGFFEEITSNIAPKKYSPEKAIKIIQNETNVFKLLRALNAISNKFAEDGLTMNKAYIIRNGKVFTKKDVTGKVSDEYKIWGSAVAAACLIMIQTRMAAKRIESGITSVILPEKVELACPVSEKMFFGNIPYGSYFPMTEHNFFGVYWRNEWGTYDFDLSFIGLNEKFGWNSSYYNSDQSLVFSGDMTNADPEAVEMFYAKAGISNGLLKLNRYSGEPGSRAEMFYGNEVISGRLQINYMVNPDSVAVRVPIVSNKREQIVGAVFDNKAYFVDLQTGNGSVSCLNPGEIHALKNKLENTLMLHDMLKEAGYEIVTEVLEENPETCLDLRDINKDKLLSLF